MQDRHVRRRVMRAYILKERRGAFFPEVPNAVYHCNDDEAVLVALNAGQYLARVLRPVNVAIEATAKSKTLAVQLVAPPLGVVLICGAARVVVIYDVTGQQRAKPVQQRIRRLRPVQTGLHGVSTSFCVLGEAHRGCSKQGTHR